ncbi:hypothetical protein I204_00305 [Kwoniella mangroviensis CBS 8886]|uniref:uncharacterized protein n=1 Tax=Kwoniella mangroviensis CBS 8507 TaxID=1296122 RepID=UPI00080D2535|nr:uncharacterized protein I203_02519 [Kwoniella mangroviensis CBS 8507]OCF67863.1 hypothetical protein I203_02519 [Kwoniella mangroviensis CBS 8507]OCF78365.1 hypothetical protein I204_00305 [Kwoniella mangroviensis CBS 8886]
MSSANYEPLPTDSSSPTYPPLPGPPYRQRHQKVQITPTLILKYVLGACGSLVIFHYVTIGAFPNSSYTSYTTNGRNHQYDQAYASAAATAQDVLDRLDPSAGQPGTFFRDSFPLRTMLAFWDLAEKEVKARGLDTCNGQLSRELVDAYHSSQLAYCVPPGQSLDTFTPVPIRNDTHSHSHSPHWNPEEGVEGSTIFCSPVHRSSFSKWWPYPAAPCVSKNLRVIPESERRFRAAGCDITDEGVKLNVEMGRERFLGSDTEKIDGEIDEAKCKERIERTLLVIGRQDQWNPFHVAEDLITTLVSVFIGVQTAPALIDSRVQLVFVEGYGMDSNHFTPLWDRMGAWAPRRLSLDPWTEGTCLTNAIHSVGAGASLLSAMGVGTSYSCASTITWAASHYYRHLFGLLPPSLSLPANLLESHHASDRPRRPINVMWLSRAKLDEYAQKHNDWSNWRDVRHITNEPELIKKFRTELENMCESSLKSGEFGSTGCVYEDAQDIPESWSLTSPETISDEDPLPIRFAMIDPTVHALETQIHFVGHTTILVSSHGGALGLSLFLPPGDGTVIELQVENVAGNYHFEHMAKEMGHNYEVLNIRREVDVDQVWESLRRWIWKVSQSG